jgi:hypothetical protein
MCADSPTICRKKLNMLDTDFRMLKHKVQLVPRIFSRGRGVLPSLAGLGEQSGQRSYYQFGK